MGLMRVRQGMRAAMLGSGKKTAWTPAQLPGVAFWLKASRDVTTQQDAFPIATVTENKGMTLAQNTGNQKPRLYHGACGINEKPVIHADGGDLLTSSSVLAGSKGAIITIFRPTGVPQVAGATLFSAYDKDTADTYTLRFATKWTTEVITVIQKNNDTYDIVRGTSTALANGVPYIAMLISSGAAYSIRVNGQAQTLNVASGGNNGDWWDDISNLDTTAVFASKSTKFTGDLAELIVVNDADLSAGDIANLEAYAVSQYGVILSTNQIAITSPKPYRVYQRDGSNQASIAITGTYTGTPTAIEARWNGGDWATLDAAPAGGAFSGTLANLQAVSGSAQGDLEVRFSNATSVTAKIKYIGIGDVLGIGGQSNASGRCTNNQVYSSTDGYKACEYAPDDRWKELTDPWNRNWDIASIAGDDSTLPAGSIAPLVATQIMERTHFPVALLPTSRGGQSFSQWEPTADHSDRSTLYGNFRVRLAAADACLAVFWEGESDVINGTAQATVNASIDNIANSLATDCGIHSVFCHIQNLTHYSNGYSNAAVNAAIAEAEGDNVNVDDGPDLSGIEFSGDHLHAYTDAEALQAATLIANAVIAAKGW